MSQNSDEFLYNMCWKLTKIISLTDSIAAGEIELLEFDGEEQARLAIQFAEARAVTRACTVTAKRRGESTLVVEMFNGFSRAYTKYARTAGMLSCQWRAQTELDYRLEKQSSLASENLERFDINPETLFETAQETVMTMREEAQIAGSVNTDTELRRAENAH